MQATAEEKCRDFEPVSITITFDTLEEASHVHDIFNNIEILSSCNNLNGEPIRRAIEKALGKTSFFATSTWVKFYEQMKNCYRNILS